MPARHIALLVEDDYDMAIEMGELLSSFGYDHVHAATQEQAVRLLDISEFCFVLLDLEIKLNEDSIKAHVEAGQHLLEVIRERFPHRNNNRHHRLQVLVVSGHGREHEYVVTAFQDGADDFVNKPVGESRPSLKVKIQNALRKSEREKHDRCRDVTREARARAPTESVVVRLAITGRPKAKRFEITIDHRSVQLTQASFVVLLRLALGRLRHPKEGWVHRKDFGPNTEEGWKVPSRLKGELRAYLPKEAEIFENDGSGSYRLHPSIELASVDVAQLESAGDARVRELAAEIKRLLSS